MIARQECSIWYGSDYGIGTWFLTGHVLAPCREDLGLIVSGGMHDSREALILAWAEGVE